MSAPSSCLPSYARNDLENIPGYLSDLAEQVGIETTAVHCNVMHSTTLQCTELHCNTLPCIALYCTSLHCIAQHYSTLHCRSAMRS